jgi:hypothetical protein
LPSSAYEEKDEHDLVKDLLSSPTVRRRIMSLHRRRQPATVGRHRCEKLSRLTVLWPLALVLVRLEQPVLPLPEETAKITITTLALGSFRTRYRDRLRMHTVQHHRHTHHDNPMK